MPTNRSMFHYHVNFPHDVHSHNSYENDICLWREFQHEWGRCIQWYELKRKEKKTVKHWNRKLFTLGNWLVSENTPANNQLTLRVKLIFTTLIALVDRREREWKIHCELYEFHANLKVRLFLYCKCI